MPCDAEASDESSPIVVGVAESVADTADLLGEHVTVLDEGIGCLSGGVVGEDGLPPVSRTVLVC